ncbi:transcriptional regulator, AraC family with amidase-like domain [Methylobacterium pseudosasicola]|uniref:Transcriptional regulator, AraC family with amidase-like domain n=1 Tax=Methylobacterium pseudosasicola TaxID=582667 RepID=A0A1I4QVP1_9HYPH|nr:transcriptional regulator, AraC family with amidase-like domain [Methylobacterium pseudosasicola]
MVLAYDGLCTFEFGCAVEVFGLPRPELGPDWYRFAVAGIEPGPLRAVGGVRVEVDGGLDLLTEAGTVIVPGWRGVDAPVPGSLCEALRAAYAAGARIVSLCSGAFVLAAAGLLDGHDATTHWRYAEALVARYPTITFVPDVLYVDRGRLLTAAGSAAGLDLCLHLVRRDHGPAIANAVARRLVLPAHRQGGQVQYVEAPVPRERALGSRLAALLDRVRAAPDEPWSLARLAAEAALSPRALHRHFRATTGQSPGDWIVATRLDRARDLLDTSRMPIAEIAAACGFGTAASLRHHFRTRLGVSPAAYRAGALSDGTCSRSDVPPLKRPLLDAPALSHSRSS